MASGDETQQALAADAATYTAGIQAVGANTPEVFYSAVTSKKPAAKATVRRSWTAADTAGNLNSATWNAHASIFSVGNSIHVATFCEFATAGDSATVFFALYDGAATPALIGITRDYTFTADATWSMDSTGNIYPSPIEIVDVHAATKIVPILRTKGSGNVEIYVEAL